jgi:hypothetical protein
MLVGKIDSFQMPGDCVLNYDAVYGDSSTLWEQPPVCWACRTRLGLGGGFFLHLVCGFCHGRDLLLVSCK